MTSLEIIDAMMDYDPKLEAEHPDDIPFMDGLKYTEDFNAVHRVLTTMNNEELNTFETHLSKIVGCFPDTTPAYNATPRQWCEAILRTHDRWFLHDSDCAVHNMPAMPNEPCDCTKGQ